MIPEGLIEKTVETLHLSLSLKDLGRTPNLDTRISRIRVTDRVPSSLSYSSSTVVVVVATASKKIRRDSV